MDRTWPGARLRCEGWSLEEKVAAARLRREARRRTLTREQNAEAAAIVLRMLRGELRAEEALRALPGGDA